ncbi:thrombomodulin [Scyliorhinus torazame]
MRGGVLFLCLCVSPLLFPGPSESKIRPEEPAPTVCVSTVCYSLQKQRRKFNMARNVCKNSEGDAMTITSTVAKEALSMLLPPSGAQTLTAGGQNFWIGLQLHQRSCPGNDSLLRGYRWLDGDLNGDYANWTAGSGKCGPRCVTVSIGRDWTDRACNEKADGVLCEYRYAGSCSVLRLDNGTATYTTPFGVNSSQLSELPPGTVALAEPWGLRFQCSNDTWAWKPLGHPAPWLCQLENGGCQHTCEDPPAGGPRCGCRPGYQLSPDGHTCQLIDPCQGAGCKHRCIVQDGSPYCLCRDGYRLDAEGKGCVDVDECLEQPCEQECINRPGNFSCHCRAGYQLTRDNKCEDINECLDELCDQRCANTAGSFVCKCHGGYDLDPNDPTKCVFYCNTDPCDAKCIGHGCDCPVGYILDEDQGQCYDIDECQSGECDQECVNTHGSFKCNCKEGFELQEDGTTCESEGSGSEELVPEPTPGTGHPARAGLSLGVVLGSIFAVAVLTLVFAGLAHHLLAKRGRWNTSETAYKSANLEQDVNLSQVSPGQCQSAEKPHVLT